MAELPSGTVTFLFTDIESSTELARLAGTSYPELITTHFDIIRSIVERSSGVVVKTTGDGVFAVFASVVGALRSAADIQIQMSAQQWPLGVEIKLRVGMHTGQATVHDNDYVGIDVHRAARVMAAGHGGQILLSETVRSLSL